MIAASLYAAIQQLQSGNSPIDREGNCRPGGQSALIVNMISSKSYSITTVARRLLVDIGKRNTDEVVGCRASSSVGGHLEYGLPLSFHGFFWTFHTYLTGY